MKRSLAGRLLRAVAGQRGSIVAPLSTGWQRERKLIADTRAMTELLLDDPAALHLLACARAARRLDGAYAEAGVYKGGSARLICEAKGEAPLHLFDVFETLQGGPQSTNNAVSAHFGQVHGAEGDVRQLLAPYPDVHFHTGIFPRTAEGLEDLRFSFVHLDMDLDDPTGAALEFFVPRMVPGAILLGDDYSEQFVKGTFDRWFAGRPQMLIELPWSQVMVVRVSG